MAGIIFKNKKYRDSHSLLEQVVHPKIQSIFKTAEIQKDKNDADVLTGYFQMIKNYIQTKKSDNSVQQVFLDAVLKNIPNDLLAYLTDHDPSIGIKTTQAGIKFEQLIAQIIQNGFQQFGGIEVGTVLATTGATFSAAEAKKLFGTKIWENMGQYLTTTIENSLTGDTLYQLAGRQGKIDLQAPSSELLLKFSSPMLQQFYSLLASASFSLKNYLPLSQGANSVYIKLGSSNLYKVYSGALAFVNFNNEDINNLYFKTRRSHSIHKKHLRMIYEMAGVGLQYEGRRLSEVKFLLVNQRGGPGIRVLSVKDELNKYLQNAGTRTSSTHIIVEFPNDNKN